MTNLPHHRLTMREQNEREVLRRNRDFATYMLAIAAGCVILLLVTVTK